MRIRNFDELDLAGDNGEVITVDITRTNNNPIINFVLNGIPWPGGSFSLDAGVLPVFKLLAQVVYKTTSGGSAEFRVTGSSGGDISIHDESQSPGEAFDVCMYSFIIQ